MNKYLKYRICKSYNIKASSLINAIFICLTISIFCGCLVLISHYQNILNYQLYEQENLIYRNDSAFNYLINNTGSIPYDKNQTIDVFEDGTLSFIEKKTWGFYDVLVCKTIFRNDTISKTALVGQITNTKNGLALYMTNYDKPLKLSGNSKILGQIKIPNGHTEQAYINGTKGNAIVLKGEQLKSGDILPKIEKSISIDVAKYIPVTFNNFDGNPIIINDFDEITKSIDLSGTKELSNITCKGNIVLISNNELKIANTAKLTDVIISAPTVHIMSGFRGNIQIIAKDSVSIDEHVSLLYPSSIYIKNDNGTASITINDHATIAGGIVIDGDTYAGALNRSLTIHEKATVIGNVYCYGKTQLEGKVLGSIYTDKFFLKTKSSNYENVILNGTINKDSLPEDFVELPLFKNNFNERKYAVIKKF
ncbi:hypothetical protein [Mariniflexile sp. HMF6888]|uniref:hypothetical protein n=1 Tax=Mariniflexile sp. HMF6888 TaxID=3373086 RepID=UPI0037BA90C9